MSRSLRRISSILSSESGGRADSGAVKSGLKTTDKLWVILAITIFIIAFALILVYGIF